MASVIQRLKQTNWPGSLPSARRDGEKEMIPDKILIPVSGNGCDENALRLASDIIKGNNRAKVYAVYVIEVKRELPLDAEISQETAKAEQALNRLEQLGREIKCPVEAALLQARDVGPAVVQEAVQLGVELIVMQMEYKRRFGSFSMGETAPYILKNAPCQVILCREAIKPPAVGRRYRG